MSSEVLISMGLVGLGGAIGAFLRCFGTAMALKFAKLEVWIGILLVNILGCFLIGLIAITLAPQDNQPGPFTHFLATAFAAEPAQTAAQAHLFLMTPVPRGSIFCIVNGYDNRNNSSREMIIIYPAGIIRVPEIVSFINMLLVQITLLTRENIYFQNFALTDP